MLATLGGLEFVGDGAAATYTIEADGLKGWLEGPGFRRQGTARPTGHGDFDSPVYLTGRVVTLSGLILTDTVSEYEDAIAALTGLLADGSAGELSVQQDTVTLTATVRRAGSPDFVPVVYGKVGRYRIDLWAADPRRYGADHSYGPSASEVVTHDGNFPASPIVTVTGAVAAPYTIASGGRSVTVTQSLSGGETHTIDMATGWVYLDGDLQSGVTSALDVFTIPPGAGATVTGPSSMTVTVTDTFV